MSAADRDTEQAVNVDAAGTAPDGDVARAETVLPLPPDEVRAFLADVERLVRLNPLLTVERWTPTERGFRCAGRNDSNGRAFDVGVTVEGPGPETALTLHYDAGLKRSTRFAVAAADGGARLVATEHYPRIDAPDDPRVAEVDKSLVPWVAALRRHLLGRRRWGWLPGWRWWNEGFLPKLTPFQRRIVRLLVWISAIEFLLFLIAALALRYVA